MNEPIEIFLGFDPGGATEPAFGWSVCKQNAAGQFEQLTSDVGHYAEEVVAAVLGELDGLPLAKVVAAGIDAPLFWNRQGELYRNADAIITGADCRNPVSINGLYGAVVAQGVLLAALLRQHFVNFRITEAFPGALLDLLNPAPAVLEMLPDETDHQRDARVAAYAAWCMHRQAPGWRDLFPEEPDPVLPLGTPVSYWMPIP